MDCCNAYESESMREALGETLRPGGFDLTERGVQYCGLSARSRVLDLGCGRGATVRYLYETHRIRACGADPSEMLISEAKQKCPYAEFALAKGEELPFAERRFDCVFAECTLSLMDVPRALRQVSRVLDSRGWFVVSDVYARNPAAAEGLNGFAFRSCMRGLHDLALLQTQLEAAGFETICFEDCSAYLRELLVKITFAYGSMSAFWNASSQDCADGCRFHEALRACKPGYFMLIARKAEDRNG